MEGAAHEVSSLGAAPLTFVRGSLEGRFPRNFFVLATSNVRGIASMCMAVKRRCLFVMLLLVGFDPAAAAQGAQPKPEDKQPVEVIPFWRADRGDQVRAALTVFGSEGQPYRALAPRAAVAKSVRQIGGWPFVFETVLPLRRDFLAKIKDKRPWPDLTRGDWKDLKEGADRAIYVVLNEAILRSNRAAADMFERSAAEYDHVTYRDLATEPNRYRGKVIAVKGKMTVLRKIESPRMVHDEISHCYFGEVIGPPKGAPPFAVLFTELPKDVKPSEEFNRQVTVQGYFIALIRFPADKETGQKEVIAPYLVGKTITVHTK